MKRLQLKRRTSFVPGDMVSMRPDVRTDYVLLKSTLGLYFDEFEWSGELSLCQTAIVLATANVEPDHWTYALVLTSASHFGWLPADDLEVWNT